MARINITISIEVDLNSTDNSSDGLYVECLSFSLITFLAASHWIVCFHHTEEEGGSKEYQKAEQKSIWSHNLPTFEYRCK